LGDLLEGHLLLLFVLFVCFGKFLESEAWITILLRLQTKERHKQMLGSLEPSLFFYLN
jgi:hypothetical protein